MADEQQRVTKAEFASSVRAKYPGKYDSMSDDDLVGAVVAKYPQYGDMIVQEPQQPGFWARTSERTLGTQHPLDQAASEAKQMVTHPLDTLGQTFKQVAIMPRRLVNTALGIEDRGTSLSGEGDYGGWHPGEVIPRLWGGKEFAEDANSGNWKGAAGDLFGAGLTVAPFSPAFRSGIGAVTRPLRQGVASGIRAVEPAVSTGATIIGAGNELLEGNPYRAAVVAGLGKPAIRSGMRGLADVIEPQSGIRPLTPLRPDWMENLLPRTPSAPGMDESQAARFTAGTPEDNPVQFPEGAYPIQASTAGAIPSRSIRSMVSQEFGNEPRPRPIQFPNPSDEPTPEGLVGKRPTPPRYPQNNLPNAEYLKESAPARRVGSPKLEFPVTPTDYQPPARTMPVSAPEPTPLLDDLRSWDRIRQVHRDLETQSDPEAAGQAAWKQMSQPGSWQAPVKQRSSTPLTDDLSAQLRQSVNASQDTELWNQARKNLGPKASFSEIAQEAQKLKTQGGTAK